jgi:hypothetical protein
MDEKRIAEIREAQKQAENIINTLHTERLDYYSEYVPLIESNQDIPWLLDQLEQAQKEIERLKDINSALENDLINANMNLERLTERVEAQRWIPVSERLPVSEDWFLIIYGNFVTMAFFKLKPLGFWGNADYINYFEFESITHWMPIPPGPKGAGEHEQT